MASAEGKRVGRYLPDDDWAVLARVCKETGVRPEVVEQMIAAEGKVFGMGRRHGIHEALEALLAEALDDKPGRGEEDDR
jgi:hypothetical protein